MEIYYVGGYDDPGGNSLTILFHTDHIKLISEFERLLVAGEQGR
jgi:hypothetical protein